MVLLLVLNSKYHEQHRKQKRCRDALHRWPAQALGTVRSRQYGCGYDRRGGNQDQLERFSGFHCGNNVSTTLWQCSSSNLATYPEQPKHRNENSSANHECYVIINNTFGFQFQSEERFLVITCQKHIIRQGNV